MSTTKVTFDLGERRVYWNIPTDLAALLLQNMVHNLGPAEEEND